MADKFINPWMMWRGITIPGWLLVRNEVSPGAKLCFGALAFFASNHSVCNPSIDWIADILGVKERQVFEYLKQLSDNGIIERQRIGLGLNNEYKFLWNDWIEESYV